LERWSPFSIISEIGVLVLEHAGENFDGVVFAALGGKSRLAGLAAIKVALDHFRRQHDAGRAAIDHHAERGAMAFTPGGEAEQLSEGIE
jgi:hypothetical protein